MSFDDNRRGRRAQHDETTGTSHGPAASLEGAAKRWQAAMGDAHRWDLLVAEEVLDLEPRYVALRSESDPSTYNGWLKLVFRENRTLAFFGRRVVAIERLGSVVKRSGAWDAAAAVWATTEERGFTDSQLKKLNEAVHVAWGDRHGGLKSHPPLDKKAVMQIAAELFGRPMPAKKPAPKCERCAELERRLALYEGVIRVNGLKVPKV